MTEGLLRGFAWLMWPLPRHQAALLNQGRDQTHVCQAPWRFRQKGALASSWFLFCAPNAGRSSDLKTHETQNPPPTAPATVALQFGTFRSSHFRPPWQIVKHNKQGVPSPAAWQQPGLDLQKGRRRLGCTS